MVDASATRTTILAAQQPDTPAAASKSLEDVLELVASTAGELCGSEMEADSDFAAHHFDSLSAVELAGSLAKATGVAIPSESPADLDHSLAYQDTPVQLSF